MTFFSSVIFLLLLSFSFHSICLNKYYQLRKDTLRQTLSCSASLSKHCNSQLLVQDSILLQSHLTLICWFWHNGKKEAPINITMLIKLRVLLLWQELNSYTLFHLYTHFELKNSPLWILLPFNIIYERNKSHLHINIKNIICT